MKSCSAPHASPSDVTGPDLSRPDRPFPLPSWPQPGGLPPVRRISRLYPAVIRVSSQPGSPGSPAGHVDGDYSSSGNTPKLPRVIICARRSRAAAPVCGPADSAAVHHPHVGGRPAAAGTAAQPAVREPLCGESPRANEFRSGPGLLVPGYRCPGLPGGRGTLPPGVIAAYRPAAAVPGPGVTPRPSGWRLARAGARTA
jgi:hypothetical protein